MVRWKQNKRDVSRKKEYNYYCHIHITHALNYIELWLGHRRLVNIWIFSWARLLTLYPFVPLLTITVMRQFSFTTTQEGRTVGRSKKFEGNKNRLCISAIVLFSIPAKSGESIAPLSPKHPPAQKGIMYAQSCNTEHFFPLQYGLLQGSIETSGRTRMRCIKTHAKVRSDLLTLLGLLM